MQAETIAIEVRKSSAVMGVPATCIEERYPVCCMCVNLCPYSALALVEIIQNREHRAE